MHKVNVTAVTDAPVTEEESRGARIKWLINEKDGDATMIPPDKKHQFQAGAETLKFICLVPK